MCVWGGVRGGLRGGVKHDMKKVKIKASHSVVAVGTVCVLGGGGGG